MINKLKNLTNNKSSSISDMSHSDVYKAKIARRNLFLNEACSFLNEEITINDTLATTEEDEFHSYLSILANNLVEKTIEIPLASMYKTSQLIIIIVGKMTNATYFSDTKDSVELVIQAFSDNIKKFNTNEENKLEIIESLNNVVQNIEYKIEGITESVSYVLKKDMKALSEAVESIDGVVPSYVDLSNNIINTHSQQDIIKIVETLPELLKSVDSNCSQESLTILNTVYKYLYSKLLLHVSALRKVSDISEDYLCDVNNDDLKKVISEQSGLFLKRANTTMNECDNCQYDVLMELGYDFFYDATEETEPSDIQGPVLAEGVIANAKENILDARRKVVTTDRRVSRRIDSIVQRIVDDYRTARKTAVEDKIMGSTVRAAQTLKTILKGGALAIIPQVGPTLSLIYLITKFCMSSKTEARYRQKLMNELITELKLVQEKIKDADSAGDNKAKYKLMRIESQLQTAIDKIKFNYPM